MTDTHQKGIENQKIPNSLTKPTQSADSVTKFEKSNLSNLLQQKTQSVDGVTKFDKIVDFKQEKNIGNHTNYDILDGIETSGRPINPIQSSESKATVDDVEVGFGTFETKSKELGFKRGEAKYGFRKGISTPVQSADSEEVKKSKKLEQYVYVDLSFDQVQYTLYNSSLYYSNISFTRTKFLVASSSIKINNSPLLEPLYKRCSVPLERSGYNLINTRRYLDVNSTLFERYGRQIDVKTTSCAYCERVYCQLANFRILLLQAFMKTFYYFKFYYWIFKNTLSSFYQFRISRKNHQLKMKTRDFVNRYGKCPDFIF